MISKSCWTDRRLAGRTADGIECFEEASQRPPISSPLQGTTVDETVLCSPGFGTRPSVVWPDAGWRGARRGSSDGGGGDSDGLTADASTVSSL